MPLINHLTLAIVFMSTYKKYAGDLIYSRAEQNWSKNCCRMGWIGQSPQVFKQKKMFEVLKDFLVVLYFINIRYRLRIFQQVTHQTLR